MTNKLSRSLKLWPFLERLILFRNAPTLLFHITLIAEQKILYYCLQLPMYVLLYPPLPFLLAFVGAQAIRIRRFSLENNSMRVHMIVVCLCGLFTLLGRVQLFWNADEVRHFFGRRLKSEVNRLRFYLEEPKHIRSSGGTVCRYGTLCA